MYNCWRRVGSKDQRTKDICLRQPQASVGTALILEYFWSSQPDFKSTALALETQFA